MAGVVSGGIEERAEAAEVEGLAGGRSLGSCEESETAESDIRVFARGASRATRAGPSAVEGSDRVLGGVTKKEWVLLGGVEGVDGRGDVGRKKDWGEAV